MTTQPPTFSALSATATATGVVTIALAGLAAGADAAGVPEWIQVTPRGPIETRDSRRFTFDPEALVARFAADGVEPPVDLDHSSSAAAPASPTIVGWVKALEARADGLWARVDWLDAGRAALTARTRRYVSPLFFHDTEGRATWIHSVALVAAPALAGLPALASTTLTQEPAPMKTVAVALGLAESASEAAMLAAVTDLKATMVPKARHDEVVAQLSAATTKLTETTTALATLQTQTRKAKVDGVLEAALAAKKILPAERESFAALCASDDGLTAVEKIIAARPAALGASGLDDRRPADPAPAGNTIQQASALAAEIAAVVAERAKAGIHVSASEALAVVQSRTRTA